MTRITGMKATLFAVVCTIAILMNGCGGGGGSTADRGTLTTDTYETLTLNSPSGDTLMTDAQAAANAEVISKAIAADPEAEWEPDPSPTINGKSITEFTETELKQLNGNLDDDQLTRDSAGRALPRADESAMRMLAADQLPSSVDWRSFNGFNYMTTVKNQQSCGSCVAFASIGTLEAMVRISQNNPTLSVDLSESDLFRCTGTGANQTGACSQGWHGYYAATQLKNVGVVSETCLPYKPQDNVCSSKCSGGTVTKIQSFSEGTASGNWGEKSTPTWIKNHLQNGPVQASIMVYQDFYQYKSGVYKHVTGAQQGGHAVVIAGYDDTGGYWIVRNSWGSDWGENGYVRIKYGQVQIEDGIIAYQMDTTTAAVSATVAPSSGTTSDTFTLTCTVSGGTATTTLEGRCNTSDSWSTISTGSTKNCVYSSAGSYTPGCRIDGTTSDDVDAAITVTTPTTSVCGNGSVETGEQCDDGNTTTETCTYGQTSCTVCDSTCQNATGATSYCGDGAADSSNNEQCDDGNTTSGDGCSASCQTETATCGNGSVETGEQCDDGNTTTETCTYGQASCTVCDSTCQNATGTTSYCGDSTTDSSNSEQCDDGNTAGGDGCSASCQNETVTCSSYITQAPCDAETLCAWNTSISQCTDDYAAICPGFSDQTSCEALNDCFWNGAACVPFDCGYFTDQTSCDADTDCAWDAFQPACEFATCASYIDQAECDATILCEWDSGSTTCVDHIFLDCVSYTDQTNCETYAACAWDSGTTACTDTCTSYSMETTCEAYADCIWDAFSSTCMAY